MTTRHCVDSIQDHSLIIIRAQCKLVDRLCENIMSMTPDNVYLSHLRFPAEQTVLVILM